MDKGNRSQMKSLKQGVDSRPWGNSTELPLVAVAPNATLERGPIS